MTAGHPGDAAATLGNVTYPTIGAALAVAVAGNAVVIRPGVHGEAEAFPLTVPPGVRLLGEPGAVVDASRADPQVAAVLLAGSGSALHHVIVVAPPTLSSSRPAVAVGATTAVKVAVRACTLRDGGILVTGGSGVTITGNDVQGGRIIVKRSIGTQVIRNRQHGGPDGAGIAMEGGSQHVVHGNVLTDGAVGIALTSVSATDVSGNATNRHDTGVEVVDCHELVLAQSAVDAAVTGIRVVGGSLTRVEENDVVDCDTAIELGPGATSQVERNHVLRARIGIAVDAAAEVTLVDNDLLECREQGIRRHYR